MIDVTDGIDYLSSLSGCTDMTYDESASKPSDKAAMIDRHYRTLVNAVTDCAIIGLDRQGRITDWNSGAQRIKGYRPEDIIGRNFSQFYTPEDQAGGEPQRALGIVASEGRFEGQGWRVRSDGSHFWADVVIEDILDDEGVPIGYVKVTRDATERRHAQQALQIAASEVEKALSDRTVALAERDVLLQEVYHRVKNNLQAIDSIIGLQISSIESSEAKAALESLRNRVAAIGLVHSQLMASGDLKTFNVALFLQELITNLADGMATADVSLSVRASPLAVGMTFAVPMALLVTELVTNALKHAFPMGKGRVDVCLCVDQNGDLTLVVADDGQGMRSSQAPPPTARGLGQHLVRILTEQLKGTMMMDTSAGTRIEITLPRPGPA